MKFVLKTLAVAAVLAVSTGQARAATTFTVDLTGTTADFTQSQFDFLGLHFDEHSLTLSGLNTDNAFTVTEGDSVDATVTLDASYTIPTSMVRTDILHFLSGSSFPSENTGVSGQFNFFDGDKLVRTFNYLSSTSGELASFAAVFPPGNGAFTFNAFTNDFLITDLATPATLDGSSFTYALVSTAVPEPASWALMLIGFGIAGGALRSRPKSAVLAS